MKINEIKKFSAWLLVLAMICSLFVCITVPVSAASGTSGTGYTCAEDVEYKRVGSYIANWGARGEVATFLSIYAEQFYTESYTYDNMSELSGGTSQNNAPSSALYSMLKALMTSKHDHQTSYGETRNQYQYTDCERNNTSKITSFYSAKQLNSAWDGGSTWNREHTWPNSKGLDGNDENDIMMLRPTSVSENSSRGNTAYGEGSGYFYPGDEVKGDCARIVLYVYTRWGNTGKMWGKSGVMENVDVLLKWMEEDPVDTWEMGRNDAVQSITGTRNVFIDYPEYAWLLFGEDVPEDVVTPSNGSDGGNTNPGDPTEKPTQKPTEAPTEPSVTPDECPLKEGVAYRGEIILPDGSLYLLGEEANQTWYIKTTQNKDEAVELYVEKVSGIDGAYRLYFMKYGVKTYIDAFEYQSGKGSLSLTTSPDNYYVFDAHFGILKYVKDSSNSYYLGTYTNSSGVTYDTVSCSNMSHITGSNESNVGVSQFPLYLIPIEEVDIPDEPEPTEPEPTEPEPTEPEPTEPEPTEPDPDSVNLNVVISEYAASNGWTIGTQYSDIVLDDVITMIIAGGDNSGKFYDSDHIRVYATDTPAGTVTFTAADGYKIVTAKIITVEGTYAFLQINGNSAEDLSNVLVAVNADTVTFNTVKNGSSGKQVRITGIEITYEKASSTPEPTEPEPTEPEPTEPEPTEPEPTEPEPTEPEPTEPEPTEPEPTEPEPTEPEPTEPEPTEPEPTEPEPTEPEPTEPEPTEPEPTEPEPTEPEPTEPEPTEPEPTEPEPTEPEPTEPEPTEPEPTEPEPTEPEPTESKPTEPEPTEPKPTEPEPTEPEPTESKPTEPEPTEPKPTEPKPTEPEPTEPEPTEPEPTESEPTESETTEPTDVPTDGGNIPASSGCNSSLGAGALAIIMSVSLAGYGIFRKKR